MKQDNECDGCALLNNHNGWNEWRNHVLKELDRGNGERAAIFKTLEKINMALSENRGVGKGQASLISLIFSTIITGIASVFRP